MTKMKVWLSLFLLIGILMSVVFIVYTHPSHRTQSFRKKQLVQPSTTTPKQPKRFEFYQLLPGMEVQVPESKQKLRTKNYWIQAGTYRQRERAEKQKNRLKILGFKAQIRIIKKVNGSWFQVSLGPFEQESTAIQQKKRLQQHQIHGILVAQQP